ncbi:MAG: hypothetical protein A2096_05020 [Spirochaetes bacterium GWF1_41_5]|nr:MAG: hypothetical protein A2096_05020 [Spirochaetes bacterium GWF1_41_5]
MNLNKQRSNMYFYKTFTKIVLLSLLSGSLAFPADNLLLNPGFEEAAGDNKAPAAWTQAKKGIEGELEWVSDTVHSGKKAVKITARIYTPPAKGYGSAAWTSSMIDAPKINSRITVSAWIKCRDVVPGTGAAYYKLRFTLYAWDEQKKKVKHWDILCTDGTIDWKKFETSLPILDQTRYLSVACSLTACTGTAWIDDVEIKPAGDQVDIEKTALSVSNSSLSAPVIIPHPWKTEIGRLMSAGENITVLPVLNDPPIISEDLTACLLSNGFNLTPADKTGNTICTVSLHASPETITDPELRKRVLENWQTLPADGYITAVIPSAPLQIFLTGKSAAARFYAVQTLKFLLAGNRMIWTGIIIDYPEMERRGMAMGLQWFGNYDEALRRLSSLKCNFIYNTGSYMGKKFGVDNWRSPFTEKELEQLKLYLENCRKYFIEPVLTFSPRGKPPTIYSSDEEIKIITDKMIRLHHLGFRSLGLSFDDLQNIGQDILVTAEDQKAFQDIGEAHFSFISKIYSEVKKLPDIWFIALPLWYDMFEKLTPRQMVYLEKLSRLPAEINMIYCERSSAGLEGWKKIMKRFHPPLIWDNFFAAWSDAGIKMTFLPPIDRPREYNRNNLQGYIVLPPPPKLEDIGRSSWYTMADYMWAPARYNPQASFSNAVMKHQQQGASRDFSEYAAFMREAVNFKPDSKNKKARIESLDKIIKTLDEWREKMNGIKEKEIRDSASLEISGRISDFEDLKTELADKEFPVAVPFIVNKLIPDGEVLQDTVWKNIPEAAGFVNIKTGRPAVNKTSFRICHDQQNLYIAVICMEGQTEKILAAQTRRDGNIFLDDCIELFLDPKQSCEEYVHIAVNTAGMVYDARHLKTTRGIAMVDKDWNADILSKTKIYKDKWTMEIAIPFSVLNSAPAGRMNFNICRERHAGEKEFSSYARLLKHGFHDPSRFWTLEFIR